MVDDAVYYNYMLIKIPKKKAGRVFPGPSAIKPNESLGGVTFLIQKVGWKRVRTA
jgi:hypothetical protein